MADLTSLQIVSVHAVRGRFWLAALVNGIPATLEAHHVEGYLTFGWINSSDYVRLHKEPHPSCEITYSAAVSQILTIETRWLQERRLGTTSTVYDRQRPDRVPRSEST